MLGVPVLAGLAGWPCWLGTAAGLAAWLVGWLALAGCWRDMVSVSGLPGLAGVAGAGLAWLTLLAG